jgi:hypothetical protein
MTDFSAPSLEPRADLGGPVGGITLVGPSKPDEILEHLVCPACGSPLSGLQPAQSPESAPEDVLEDPEVEERLRRAGFTKQGGAWRL